MTVAAAGDQQDAPRSRVRIGPLVGPGLLLWIGYSFAGTWSIGQGFGGVDDDGGWTDFAGRPTRTAPPVVDVVGHPALWVAAVLAAILLAAAVWASRGDDVQSRRRQRIGIGVATAFIVAVVLVCTVLQTQLIDSAFSRGDPHPPIIGNASVTTHPMSAG